MRFSKSFASLAVSVAVCLASSTYPSQDQIATIFSYITGPNPSFPSFFSHVSPNISWTIEGTHPAAGVYTNLTVLEATFQRISATASAENPFSFELTNIIGGGDEAWSVQELHLKGVCKNGLVFDNRYAWVTRWENNSTIVETRAYLDSALVSAALQQNELATFFTYSTPRDTILPYVELTENELKNP